VLFAQIDSARWSRAVVKQQPARPINLLCAASLDGAWLGPSQCSPVRPFGTGHHGVENNSRLAAQAPVPPGGLRVTPLIPRP
jgi:hypothetical protein